MRFLAMAFLAAACFATTSAAQCPAIRADNSGRVPSFESSADVLDTVLVSAKSDSLYLRWNAPEGDYWMRVSFTLGLEWAELLAEDRFVIQGLPPGTPVSFTARLDVASDAWRVGGTHSPGVDAYLGAGPSGADSNQVGHGGVTFNGTLRLPLQRASEDPFLLHIALFGAVGDIFRVAVGGKLSFEGLPGGTSIVSCHGYRQDVPTPTQAVSWGSLKARYR